MKTTPTDHGTFTIELSALEVSILSELLSEREGIEDNHVFKELWADILKCMANCAKEK